MQKLTIALNMIGRDNADSIIDALDSTLTANLDEYVFCDTGSKDRTIELFSNWCESNNRKYKVVHFKDVYGYDWSDDFALYDFGKARQLALDNTKSDLIFWFDTDDIVEHAERMTHVIRMFTENPKLQQVLMPYRYGVDQFGNDIIKHDRERIFRRINAKWNEPVHEFINMNLPDDESTGEQMVRIDFIDILHKRKPEHIKRTARRNLIILNHQYEKIVKDGGKPHFRLLQNLAYDHWEHGEWEKSAEFYRMYFDKLDKLSKENRDKQSHELQVLQNLVNYAKALYELGQLKECEQILYRAMGLDDFNIQILIQLAELRNKQGKVSAAEYYAKSAIKYGTRSELLPANEIDLKIKPHLILAGIYRERSDFEKTKLELNACKVILKSNPMIENALKEVDVLTQSKSAFDGVIALGNELLNEGSWVKLARLDDILPVSLEKQRVKDFTSKIKIDAQQNIERLKIKLKDKKNIAIFTGQGFEDWAGNSKDKGIGGSEEMAIGIAKELAVIGNDVTVFNSCGELAGNYDGVQYKNWKEYDPDTEYDILIISRIPQMFLQPHRSKRQYLWLHDTTYGDIPTKAFGLADEIFVLSDFHKSVIQQTYGISDNKFWITRNGIDSEHYLGLKQPKRNSKQIIYASSYDRGLYELLMSFKEIKKAVPDALPPLVYYGWDTYDKRMEQMAEGYSDHPSQMSMRDYKKRCVELMGEFGVKDGGRIGQDELYLEMAKSSVWLYPTWFSETSCCSGDTKILMPRDHLQYPEGIPIKELVGKKDFHVYSYDLDTHQIKLGKVKWVAMTRKNAELYQITLDNGTKMKFTGDHKFLTRDGEYVEVQNLEIGQSLMPCYERPEFMIKQPNGSWTPEHRMVCETVYGDIEGKVIDHIDGNRFNNTIDNLQPLTRSEHAAKTFNNINVRDLSKITRSKMRTAQKKWATSDKGKKHLSDLGKLRSNKLWEKIRSLPESEQKAWFKERSEKVDRVKLAETLKTKWANQFARSPYYNHKIIAIERLEQREDVYDMEVEQYHNFAADGVFVHNCITAMRAQLAGCIPVVTPIAALKETCKSGFQGDMDYAIAKTIDILKYPHRYDDERTKAVEIGKTYSLKLLAQEWNKHFEK